MIYMDHNATTQPDPEVLDAMEPFFRELWGNPSSVHDFGAKVRGHVDAARAQVGALIGADASEIVFTSCGTESANWVLSAVPEMDQGPKTLVTTAVEHACVLEPAKAWKKRGLPMVSLSVDKQGLPNLDAMAEHLSEPVLLSMMWANNETGVLLPVAEAASRVRAAGGLVYSDAVQAVGKVPIDVKAVDVDLLSMSGHKLYAPKGVGALYVRRGLRLPPMMKGGHHENGMRAGTENVPYMIGFGKACELAKARMDDDARRVAGLRDRLQAGLVALGADLIVNGGEVERLPGTLNVSIRKRESDSLLFMLSDAGIAAAAGATCSTGVMKVSHVIRAMNVPREYQGGTLRFSLGRATTEADVSQVIEVMASLV